MKKFSKLLAALLTVCLLCGMVLPFASMAAEGAGEAQDTTTTHTVNSLADLESITLKNGDTIKTTVAIEGYDPNGVINFLVDCEGEATFALAEAVASNYDEVVLNAENDVYLYVNKQTANVQLSDMDVTNGYGHGSNTYFQTDFTKSGTYSYTNTDDDLASDIKHEYVNGYFRIFGSGTTAYYPGEGGRSWGPASSAYMDLLTSKYAVIDIDYGTDRYTFTYTVNGTRTSVATGSKVTGTKVDALNFETTLTNEVVHKTITAAEYEEYLSNPEAFAAKLLGTFETSTYYAGNASNSNKQKLTITQTDTYTSVDIDEDSFAPAYNVGNLQMQFAYRSSDTATKDSHSKLNYVASIVQDPETGLYYAVPYGTTYSEGEKAILLSNKVGVTDHVTVVMDNGVTNAGYYTAHAFINGEYLGSRKSAAKNTYHVLKFRGFGQTVNANKNVDCYSLMFDNATINLYGTVVEGVNTATYTSAEGVYGVDKLVADINAKTYNSVTQCTDVFYTGKNVGYNGWLTTDGGKTIAYTDSAMKAAIANLGNGATVITTKHINDAQIPALSSFYVRCLDGAKFYLAEAFEDTYNATTNGDTTYYLNLSITMPEFNAAKLSPLGTTDKYNKAFYMNGNSGKYSDGLLKHDSTYATGVTYSTTGGYFRIFKSETTAVKSSSNSFVSMYLEDAKWKAYDYAYTYVNLFDSSLVTLDFDFGTDSYTFSYVADATTTKTATVSLAIKKNGTTLKTDNVDYVNNKIDFTTEYANEYEDIIASEQGDKTFYTTVSTAKEYETYKNDLEALYNYVKGEKQVSITEQKISKTSQKGDDKYEHIFTVTITNTDTFTAVKSVNDDLTLAYSEGAGISTFLRLTTEAKRAAGDYDERHYFTFFRLVQDEATKLWYLSDDAEYSKDDILLVNEVGKTDHITLVSDNVTTPHHIVFHVYVNGEYVKTLDKIPSAGGSTADPDKSRTVALVQYDADESTGRNKTSNLISASMCGIGVIIPGGDKNQDKYAYMMDNVAFNWYRTDAVVDNVSDSTNEDAFVGTESWSAYTKPEGSEYSILDLLADLNAGNVKPLYACDDVVYTTAYVAETANWAAVVGGTATYIPALFTADFEDGDVLVTNANSIAIPSSINSFNLVSKNDNGTKVYGAYLPDAYGVYSKVNLGTEAYLDLSKDITFNLLIPASLANVKVDGVALTLDEALEAYVYKWNTNLASFDAKTVAITLTYGEYDLAFDITLDVVKYAELVVDYYKADSIEARLAKEIVDYKVAVATYLDETFNRANEASVAAFDAVAADVADTVVEEFAQDASCAGTYLLNSDGSFDMIIEAAEAETISVTFAEGRFAGLSLVDEDNIAYEDGKYVISGIRAAFIDDVVSVKIGNNEPVIYSIRSFFAASDANVQTLGKALVAYAQASEAFVVIPEN